MTQAGAANPGRLVCDGTTMADRFLDMPDGSRVILETRDCVHPTILYCSRDTLSADSTTVIPGAFRDQGFGVSLYQAPYEVEARAAGFEASTPPDSIEFRAESLARAFAALHPKPSLLVGHSSGARFASMVADQCGVRGVILFGYPFKHPDLPDEPERYAHLATIETPCLLIQGSRDEYGGDDIAGKYPFSRAVTVAIIDGSHNLEMFRAQRVRIFAAIHNFIRDKVFASLTR